MSVMTLPMSFVPPTCTISPLYPVLPESPEMNPAYSPVELQDQMSEQDYELNDNDVDFMQLTDGSTDKRCASVGIYKQELLSMQSYFYGNSYR